MMGRANPWGCQAEIATEDEFDAALARARASNDGPALIEIVLDRLDTSEGLKRLGAALSSDRGGIYSSWEIQRSLVFVTGT